MLARVHLSALRVHQGPHMPPPDNDPPPTPQDIQSGFGFLEDCVLLSINYRTFGIMCSGKFHSYI